MFRFLPIVVLSFAGALMTRATYAHGFGERYDLPVPLNFFLFGAGGVVVMSFILVGIFVKHRPHKPNYMYFNLFGFTWLQSGLNSHICLTAVRIVSVMIFLLVVATALTGTERPIDNFAPTMVWIIWWVGMGYVTAALGNLWMLVNPWKIIFEWFQAFLSFLGRSQKHKVLRYPKWLDMWPAVFVFLLFGWIENIYPNAAQPQKLGLLVIAYSFVTWAGMAFFGKHQWLGKGEVFTILFGLFSRFAITEVRCTNRALCKPCAQGCLAWERCVNCYECIETSEPNERELNVRPFAVGLSQQAETSVATSIFVLLALAMVTFDGLTETSLWVDFQTVIYPSAQIVGGNTVQIIDTLGLILVLIAFILVYFGFSWVIRECLGEPFSVSYVASKFVFALVPIALAYNLAHYASFLLIQGQLVIPLLSDPFGYGWNLFGGADYNVNIGVINAKAAWFISVTAIVLGHVISVYLAHMIALSQTKVASRALKSQYPMLLLMVLYTATSLWIVAQPIVNEM